MASVVDRLNLKAAILCKDIVRMCTIAGSGHPSSGLSLVHMVTALMYNKMRYSPSDAWNNSADRLVLSEGHAVPVIYAAYADLEGVVGKSKAKSWKLSSKDLSSLRKLGSVLDGHPNPAEGMPFFDAATGSLGQGASVAAGLALAARTDGSDRIIYCFIGDGESREGQIWEAVDFIAERGLNNVVLIFNCNGQGQSDYVASQQSPKALAGKLAAAGLNAKIIDGHNIKGFLDTLKENMGKGKPPLAICAETIKGWGSSILTSGNWHGKPLPAADVETTMKDYDRIISKMKSKGIRVGNLQPGKPAKTTRRAEIKKVTLAKPSQILKADKAFRANGAIATRRAYGLALVALGRANKNVVGLDADVKNSTFAIYFHEKYPDRFFECRIAEQNMLSMAVGLSAAGKIPFVSSFGKFFSRAYDQIEMAAIGRANIKITGSHSGVTLGADGPSQMSLSDVAFFASMSTAHSGDGTPICVVLQPIDGVSAVKMTELMANHKGMCYMRTLRSDTPTMYKDNERFVIGGTKTVVKGKDIAIFGTAFMVHEAMKAAELLKADGIKASVVDAYSLPIKAGEVTRAARANKNRILTVEDNYGQAMGAAVAQIAAAEGGIKVSSLNVPKIPKSARDVGKLLKYLSLDAKSIAKKAKQMI